MSYTALYRKFRPQEFEDVKGQEHIVTTLKNQIKADRIGHAYLFCGPRGILCLINDAHCLGFDRDSPLTLQIHIIENLCLHLTAGQRSCFFYDSIRKCRLTVINMGNNTKITNFALID